MNNFLAKWTRSIKGIFILMIFISVSVSQSTDIGKYTSMFGEITYVTTEVFYINVGTKDDVSIGDRVMIYRSDRYMGRGEITHISSKTAVCRLIDGNEVQTGDKIEIQVARKSPSGSEAIPVPEGAPAVAEPVKKVKIDGSITAKLLHDNNGAGGSYTRQQTYFSFNSRGIAGIPLTISATGNMNLTTRENASVSPQMNQLDFRYEKSVGIWQLSAGRMMDMTSSGAGSTDGFRLSGDISTLMLSIVTGIWDSPTGKKDFKNTVSVRWKKAPLHLSSLSMDVISRKYDQQVDEFFAFNSTLIRSQKWRGSAQGLVHVFDGRIFRFTPRQMNIGVNWNYSQKFMAALFYHSTSGTGMVGGYSPDLSLNVNNRSVTASIRYEFDPEFRTTFSSTLHQVDGNGNGHQFSIIAEQDRWSRYSADFSVGADFFTSKFYRSYLLKTGASKRINQWNAKSEIRILNQTYRPDSRTIYSIQCFAGVSRKMMKNNYLGARIEISISENIWDTYFAVDYTLKF